MFGFCLTCMRDGRTAENVLPELIVAGCINNQCQSERGREVPLGNMGSSISGMARPANAGLAMPQKSGIDRAGCRRVRMDGRA